MSSWEVVDDDEEVVVVDEEEAGEEEEVVVDEEEVVGGDVEVVGRPTGDPVLSFIYGLEDKLPSSLGAWTVPMLLAELRRLEAQGRRREAGRAAAVIFEHCPSRPRLCPVYSFAPRCPFGLERRCSVRARRRAR